MLSWPGFELHHGYCHYLTFVNSCIVQKETSNCCSASVICWHRAHYIRYLYRRLFIVYSIIYEGVSKIFRTDAVKILKITVRPIGRHHPRSSSLPHVDTGPTSPEFLKRFLEVLFCQSVKHSAIRPGSPQRYQTGVLSVSILFLEIGISHRVPSQGSTVGGGWQPFNVSPETVGWRRYC
jgi:hypothetical protein